MQIYNAVCYKNSLSLQKFNEDPDFELVCTTNLLEKTLREMYLDLEKGFRYRIAIL